MMSKYIGVLLFFLVVSTAAKQLKFYDADTKLEEAIYKATKKHTLYSYNLANITTPGFEPLLYPEDRRELEQIMPVGGTYSEKVLLEHMTSMMARNRNLHASYLTLYKKRFDTYRQIATMGKR